MPYLQESTIAAVKDLDIVQVLSKYLMLKKIGQTYSCCSPFTNEKTASFHVSPSKQMFKCFSTGKGGDAIAFVCEHQSLNFQQSIEEIAQANNITIEYSNDTEEQATQRHVQYLTKESIRIALELAQDYYSSNELPKITKTRHWTKEVQATWGIGYVPTGWDNLSQHAKTQGMALEQLAKADLVRTNDKGNTFDFFRNRITFPYHDHKGLLVGFVARAVDKEDEKYKYLYLGDKCWTKGSHLYGLHQAKNSIRNMGFAYLVEGNTDVIAMHSKTLTNTVGTGGSRITPEQIKLLKQYTDTVVMFPDNDIAKEQNAGIIAMIKNGMDLVRAGLYVKVLIPCDLKEPTTKSIDPEEFLLQFNDGNKEQLNTYFARPQQFVTEWYLNNQHEYASTGGIKEKKQAINNLFNLVDAIPDTEERQLTHDDIAYKWQDYKKLKGKAEQKNGETEQKVKSLEMTYYEDSEGWKNLIPVACDWDEVEEFHTQNNYFQFANRVWIAKSNYIAKTRNFTAQSNFTFEVLFHLLDDEFPKRLVKIINVQDKEMVVDIKTDDLSTPARFKQTMERYGNYIWKGGNTLEIVKEYQYTNEKSGHLKETLGHDPNGFYAMSNGVFHYETKQWLPLDYTGVVKVEDSCYYIPSGNAVYENNEYKYQTEKQFKYKPNNTIDFKLWSQLYCDSYPQFGCIGISFIVASIFSDVVFGFANGFPLLFTFGAGGSGKGSFIKRLLALFGDERKGLKLSTKANTDKGLIRSLAQYSNAGLLLDEYTPESQNNEYLKSIWDRDGYTKGNITSRYGSESTPVNTSVGITSNYEPNDEALFTRIIYLVINAQSYTEKQRESFDSIKAHERLGLGDVLLEILSNRTVFEKSFNKHFGTAVKELNKELSDFISIDRVIINISVLLATFDTLHQVLSFPFDREHLKNTLKDLSISQQQKIDTGGEVSKFFGILQYLAQKGEVSDGFHYEIKGNELCIRMSMVYALYNKEFINQERGKKPVSKQVLFDTLSRSDVFKEKKQVRFPKTSGSQSCHVFDLEKSGFEPPNYGLSVANTHNFENETNEVFGEVN